MSVDINARTAPIYRILVSAADSDSEASAILDELTRQRQEGQGRLATSLASDGALRPGLRARDAADLIHALASTGAVPAARHRSRSAPRPLRAVAGGGARRPTAAVAQTADPRTRQRRACRNADRGHDLDRSPLGLDGTPRCHDEAMYDEILYEVNDPVAVITLNRPTRPSTHGPTRWMARSPMRCSACSRPTGRVVGIVVTGAGARSAPGPT